MFVCVCVFMYTQTPENWISMWWNKVGVKKMREQAFWSLLIFLCLMSTKFRLRRWGNRTYRDDGSAVWVSIPSLLVDLQGSLWRQDADKTRYFAAGKWRRKIIIKYIPQNIIHTYIFQNPNEIYITMIVNSFRHPCKCVCVCCKCIMYTVHHSTKKIINKVYIGIILSLRRRRKKKKKEKKKL